MGRRREYCEVLETNFCWGFVRYAEEKDVLKSALPWQFAVGRRTVAWGALVAVWITPARIHNGVKLWF